MTEDSAVKVREWKVKQLFWTYCLVCKETDTAGGQSLKY
jgi:hypothetical protein